MKEIAKFSTECLSHQLVATVFIKGGSLIVDISGPNDHLGGIGIGIPYLRKNGEESANFHCVSFPSHRDGELAASMARIIAKITRCYTVVIFGIHFPDLTKAQISEITYNLESWVTNWSYQLSNEAFSS